MVMGTQTHTNTDPNDKYTDPGEGIQTLEIRTLTLVICILILGIVKQTMVRCIETLVIGVLTLVMGIQSLVMAQS